MNTLELLFIAIGLAMDCFAVSLCTGIGEGRLRRHPMLTMAFFFGLFQGAMPLIGWAASVYFSRYIESIDHWIAFGLLAFLGFRMIREDLKADCTECGSSSVGRLSTILLLAVATSIDALAVGISFTCVGYRELSAIFYPVFLIGLVSFLFSVAGFVGGVYFGRRFHPRAGLLGGIILIGIGLKVLGEHLGYLS